MAVVRKGLAVVGSRSFRDYRRVEQVLDDIVKGSTSWLVISGGAAGADNLAAQYARARGLDLVEHIPDWGRHGRAAGFKRNQLIVQDAALVVAFWDGVSKGTAHTIRLAKRAKIPVLVAFPDGRQVMCEPKNETPSNELSHQFMTDLAEGS